MTPDELGLLGKLLQGGTFAGLTGVFAWFIMTRLQKSIDEQTKVIERFTTEITAQNVLLVQILENVRQLSDTRAH